MKAKGNGLKISALIFWLLELLTGVGMIICLAVLNILPIGYILGIGALVGIILALQFLFLIRCATVVTFKRIFSIVLSIIFSSGYILGIFASSYYVGGLFSTLKKINTEDEYTTYSIRVLNSSSINSLNDVTSESFGTYNNIDETEKQKCIDDIKNNLKKDPTIKEYDDADSLAKAVLANQNQLGIFDEALMSMIDENMIENNKSQFSTSTKIIHEIKFKSQQTEIEKRDIDITKNSFNILISGMDSSGAIKSRGNSDVNMIVTVNPTTGKILMTNTPRDFYVPLRGDTNKMDKLTHAGAYGIDCSVETLSKYYNIPIDYYVKVNFSSVVDIVDALGGITVDSDVAFSATLRSGGKASFTKGKNNLNGEQALSFSRERKSFASGDRQRGINQQKVIQAIINKLKSPSILTKFNSILNVLNKNVQTNMTASEIQDLIKMQINTNTDWSTESISVDGTGASKKTYSYKASAVYVMIPNESTVTTAKQKIKETMGN